MRLCEITAPVALAIASMAVAQTTEQPAPGSPTPPFGRVLVRTMPTPEGMILRSATYTPSGNVLVSYARSRGQGERQLDLAVMNDEGRNVRPVWSGVLPERPKDNGIRFMVFPDNKRVFLGDFILECEGSLDACAKPRVLPVDYPAAVDGGPHIMNRWSEMIVAPDNRHIGWDTLLAGGRGVVVFTGALERAADRYRIVQPQIVSTLEPFRPDPRHRDGVIPVPMRGGEIKQFVRGGTALSLVGAVRRDVPDSVVQDLPSGRVEAITDAPGYDETTIFSPDERLGLTMTSRFSPGSDPAILGLMPRPYPATLQMGLSMLAYTYAVTGVRRERPGNIGPALIDIAASKTRPGYLGQNLNLDPDWVFRSPMSWHPSGKKGMWLEGHRGDNARRVRIVSLPDYRPGPRVAPRPTPAMVPYGSTDLSWVGKMAAATGDIDVKVYGQVSGFIRYRRVGAMIEKTYTNYSDNGRSIYSGIEKTTINPVGRSVYTADVRLTGPKPGIMAMQITFGALRGPRPAALDFSPDASGQPATRGYVEYGGRRLEASALTP
jgi:hypothetical protein